MATKPPTSWENMGKNMGKRWEKNMGNMWENDIGNI